MLVQLVGACPHESHIIVEEFEQLTVKMTDLAVEFELLKTEMTDLAGLVVKMAEVVVEMADVVAEMAEVAKVTEMAKVLAV